MGGLRELMVPLNTTKISPQKNKNKKEKGTTKIYMREERLDRVKKPGNQILYSVNLENFYFLIFEFEILFI